MKANKTVKMLMSLVLCFALVLSTMMLPIVAASVGDTVDVDAEFGTLVQGFGINTSYVSGTDLKDTVLSSAAAAGYYTNYHIAAYYAEDATHGKVAVMKKGVADAEYDGVNKGSAYAAVRDFTKWTDKTNYSDEFIFDVYFKVPVAEDVTTYLFNGSNSPWSGTNTGNTNNQINYLNLKAALKGGLMVKNGYIYQSGDYTTAINTTQLTADTWYRIVRQIKGGLSGSTKILYEKFMVIDSNNQIVAQLSDWTQVGAGYTAGSNNAFAALAFTTDYPDGYTGTEAAISKMNIYQNPVSATLTASAMLEGSNRVLEYDASGEDVDSSPLAERISGYAYNMERQNAYITFRIPEGNGTLKLFRWNDANGKYAGIGTTHKDSFAVTVENGKVYANIYNANSVLNAKATASTPAKSYTVLEETSTGSGVYYTKTDIGTTLDSNKWYTIEIKRENMMDNTYSTYANVLNIYEGKVSYNYTSAGKKTGTVTGNLIKTWGNTTDQKFILPYVSSSNVLDTTNNRYVSACRTMTFVAGYGYEKPVYIDAFNLDAWDNMSSTAPSNYTTPISLVYGVANNWTLGFDNYTANGKTINIGDDFTTFRYYNTPKADGSYNANAVQDVPTGIAKVTYDPDFLGTGVTYTRTVPTIKVLFDADVAFDNSIITLKDALGNAVNFTASYDAATKTATLTGFDKLAYDGVYTLNIGAAKTAAMGFDTAANSYTFECVDSFVVSNAKILDSADADVTTSPANGAVINGAVTLQNMSDESRPYLVILALYNGTMMKDVVATSGNITAGTILPIETPTITVAESGCSAKVMVWESWTNIMPKAGAYAVGAAQ